VPDHAPVVDEKDAVVDVLEHAAWAFERQPLLLDLASSRRSWIARSKRGDE